jgi:dCTP deaminase
MTDVEVVVALHLGNIKLTPLFQADQLGPTVDLRLGTEFIVKKMDKLSFFDILRFNEMSMSASAENDIERYYDRIRLIDPSEPFVLHPGQFALGSTLEYIELSADIGAQLEGRSSWAREGLNVHSTAGLIHPGHRGIIVFELQNLGTHPLPLYAGTRVAQLLFYRLPTASKRPYSTKSRYFGMTETRYGAPWKDWEYAVLRRAARSAAPAGEDPPIPPE